MRTVPTYRKDIGPRLGFAYQIDSKTVVRGGVGIYFGMSPATNFQYPGSAFRKTANLFFTNNDFATQSATLENPFPSGFTGPQGNAVRPACELGLSKPERSGHDRGARRRHLPVESGNAAGAAQPDRGWRRLRCQPQHPSALVWHKQPGFHAVGFAGADFQRLSTYESRLGNGQDCDRISASATFFRPRSATRFTRMFNTPCTPLASNPCFNEPNSNYGEPTLPLGNLLDKYPQFAGDFEGLMLENANSWYNAMQIRFQKRTTHHVSFEGSYTISKETDDSSAGRNNWVGALGLGTSATTGPACPRSTASAPATRHSGWRPPWL